MKKLIFLIYSLFITYTICFAQKEANIWYFGNHWGLDFNTVPPTILKDSKLFSRVGSGSIADSAGNLLCYSQGDTLWNKEHKIMENGIGLSAWTSHNSSSAAIIVRQPLSKKYYIFNACETSYGSDVFYSIIDMKANNGKGKVIEKRRLLVNKSAEKIALVQHANKRDIWIAVKQGLSDTLFVFLLTPAGISNSVLKYKTYLDYGGKGQIKFSPNGKYLAFANLGNPYEDTCSYLYNFDNCKGTISKQRKIHSRSYSIEFSPNSKYLYLRFVYGKLGLHQYPIKNIKTDMWPDSNCFYLNLRMGMGHLQLAPNGKIYGYSGGDSVLIVINFPNLKGPNCDYQNIGQKFLETTNLNYQNYVPFGLPSFMASYFKSQSFTFTSHCINESTQFVLVDSLDNDSIKWDFGDTLSQEKNFSNKTRDVSHVYSQYGEYTVKLITFYDNSSDTNTELVRFVNPKPNFTASDVCENDTVRFFDKSSVSAGKLDFYWKFGDGQNTHLHSPSHFYKINGVSKTYNVTLVATMADGCADSITKQITVNEKPVSDFNFNINQNKVDFKAVQQGNTAYQWNLGNGDSAFTKDLNYTYSKSGNYSVCLKAINVANCFSQTCKKVAITVGIPNIEKDFGFKIYPNPNNGIFEIEMINSSNNVQFEIYNSLGAIVIKEDITHYNMGKYSFDLESASGIYLVKIKSLDNLYFQKLIINNR